MFWGQYFFLGLAVLSAAGPAPLFPRAASVKPRDDPFYVSPSGLDQNKPGDILRTRPAPNPLANVLPFNIPVNVKSTYQVMYRTTDSVGQAVAAVTTLIIPHNAESDKLLSYQTAYDSADNNCAPSYTLQQNNTGSGNIEGILIAAALNQGWYVNVPDYEGLNAGYVAGVLSGQATLDSVRASLLSGSFSQLSADAKFGMMGYSGGSLASEWAAELAAKYAPELLSNFVGTAIGGLTPNVSSVLLTINKTPFASLAPTGIVGLASQYANFSAYLDQHLIPSKKAAFYSVRNCSNTANFAGQDIFSYFDRGNATLTDPVPSSVIETAGIQGRHGTPQTPLYIYKAIGDEISPGADTDKLVNQYCNSGENVNIEYRRNLVGGHLTEAIFGAPSAFAWIKDRLSGVPVAQGCVKKDVIVSQIDPEAGAALGDIFVAALLANLGLPLQAFVAPGV